MPELPAVASSPIAFSSPDGSYFLLPLNDVYFDANGALKADRWPLYATYHGILDPFLATLQSEGVLRPGPEPPHKPAFTATAKTPGASGIRVTIDISNVIANAGNPPASTAKVIVTETDTYSGLKPDQLVDAIGNAANGGKRPGLAFVKGVAAPSLPQTGIYPMAGDPGTTDVTKDGGVGIAFTLQTRDGGPDALLVAAEIKNVVAAQSTFTLVLTWAKTQNAIPISGLGAAFGYVLDVQAPPDGFLAPAEGTTTLSGGSDAVAINPAKASAVIVSS